MATVVFNLGRNAKLYIGSAGATDAANEVKRVTDVQLSMTRDAIDTSSRESADVKTYLAGPSDWELSFTILCSGSDTTGYDALREAFLDGAAINAKAVSSASGAGVKGSWIVTEFSEDQSLSDIVKASVKLKPTIYDDTYLPVAVS